SEAGLTAGVDVRVVAEYIERVRSYAARRNVDDAWQQLAGDLVHIRDHEEQTLRRGVGRGERARRERAVYGTGGAGLRLHFHYLYLIAEDVFKTCRRPGIGKLRHNAGRSDRI